MAQRAFALIGAFLMFTFSNPVVGGQDTLVRQGIQSENFQSGILGWRIDRNGNAEFNNVVIRGDLITGTTPPSKHIEILQTPGNQIQFYTGEITETSPGMVGVQETSGAGAGKLNVTIRGPRHTDNVGFDAFTEYNNYTGGTSEARTVANSIWLDSDTNLTSTQTWKLLNETLWRNLTLSGTWVTSGGFTPQYLLDAAGNVHLRGRVQGGAVAAVGTLPVGFRPSVTQDWALKSNNDAASVSWVSISNLGVITVIGNLAGAQTQLSLSGVEFSTY